MFPRALCSCASIEAMDINTAAVLTHETRDTLITFVILCLGIGLGTAFIVLFGHRTYRGMFLSLVVGLGLCVAGTLPYIFMVEGADNHRAEAAANIEGRAEFEHGITELSPMNDPIAICEVDSAKDAAEYAWTDSEGASVYGYVTKSAEVDGECVYSFNAEGVAK